MIEQAASTGSMRPNPVMQPAPIMRLDGVSKRYGGGAFVVQDLDLDLREGEFLTLLGPSGCGKSTTLRMMAGLERPDGGRILLHGRDITADPPHRRPVNTVFQDYALFPHLSVRRNIGFGLVMQRLPKSEIRRRVDAMLDLVGLAARADDRPASLSGGQKQRVALARALVREPSVLLLDEPLSALDAQLRQQMQSELKSLQARVGITFMLVTHDQTEALSLSDRIAVMQGGRILQLGTPDALYDRPDCAFVARFLGATNLLAAHRDGADMVRLDTGGNRLRIVPDAPLRETAGSCAGPCQVSIRPADIRLAASDESGNVLDVALARILFHGDTHRLECMMPGGDLLLADIGRHDAIPGGSLPGPGASLRLHLPPERLRVLGACAS